MHEQYMSRCFELALSGGRHTKTNPMVGAVLVHEGRIIGEGYHKVYGSAHAEVNCINSVSDKDKRLIPLSTLYVSLEPCNHYGKTPPCSQLIIDVGIKKVMISCQDPFKKVDGQGISRLMSHGINVTTGILEEKGKELLKKFTANISQRPYVLLKFAQSKDNYMGRKDEQLWLSNSYSKTYVHKLRSEYDGILVGTNTAILDNPQLTNRNYFGEHPIRLVIDKSAKIPLSHHVLCDDNKTIIFTHIKRSLPKNKTQILLPKHDDEIIPYILKYCFDNQIYSIIVEGGRFTLKAFIQHKYWDEALIIKTKSLIYEGIKAPRLEGNLMEKIHLDSDILLRIRPRI